MKKTVSLKENSDYKEIYNSLYNGTTESVIRDTLLKIDKITTVKYPSSIATVYSYLHLKEVELSRLTTALECIRYGLEPQEKLGYILR